MHLKMASFVYEYALYNMQFIFDEIFARQTLTALSVAVAIGADEDVEANEEEKIALTLETVGRCNREHTHTHRKWVRASERNAIAG